MEATNILPALALGLALAAAPYATQAQVTGVVNQTLDTVQVFGGTKVLERIEDPADPPLRYADTGLAGTSVLSACQLTSTQGLFCLDGSTVVRWTDPEDNTSRDSLFACSDVSGIVGCTGLTVESTGNVIWLAGRNKGKTHNLVKVMRSPDDICPSAEGWKPVGTTASPEFQSCTWVAGRPLLVDITSVDGSAAEALNPACTLTTCAKGQGILGLEERRRVVFYPTQPGSTVPPGGFVEIASGKTSWTLAGNEQLRGASLFQTAGVSYVVATTSQHRVLRSTTDGTSTVIPLAPALNSACSSKDPQYGIRSSAKSGRLYITDRDCRRALAFLPVAGSNGPLSSLSEVESLPTGTVAPEGPTIAAGRPYSLLDFAGAGNALLTDVTDGQDAARLSEVVLADRTRSGMTLFQVQRIPDCRWITANRPGICERSGVIHPDDVGKPAAGQRLNGAALMPREITDLFAASGGLPPLYIQPQYRGQAQNGHYFEALFAVTEEGVIFEGTYEMELWVDRLTSDRRQLGCEPLQSGTLPEGTSLSRLLNWDVASKVSENYIGLDGEHQDTLINIGCGSIRVGGSRTSMISYNMEITPHTYVDVTGDGNPELARNNDAVFAQLLLGLYADLGKALEQVACSQVDVTNGYSPLSAEDCSALRDVYGNGRFQLDRCFEATLRPRQNAAPNNCQSFLSKLTEFQTRLAAAQQCVNQPPPVGAIPLASCDPANRRGELTTRARTIEHVFLDRFVPSVPPAGFCNGRVLAGCPGP